MRRQSTFRERIRRRIDALVASALPGGYRLYPALANVEGYLFPHEAVFLYWIARGGPGAGAIVEIGSYCGRSTLCLASGVGKRPGTRIVSVDPHVYGTEPTLRENLARFSREGAVEIIVSPSVMAGQKWQGPIRMLFVDGDHDEGGVLADLMVWAPHVAPGGFVLLHDSAGPGAFPGPRAVARKRLVVGEEFDAVGEIGSITWGRRAGSATPWLPPRWGGRTVDPLIRRLQAPRDANLTSAS